MGLRITGNSSIVEKNLSKAQHDAQNSLERLSSGTRFTRAEPLPADRAISDSLSMKMRELASYKRNANDGMSVVQTADSALNEISNIVIRMKELTTQAASSTLSDKERNFLFVEYQSLHNEVDRIAKSTTFNGMDLLNGNSAMGEDKRNNLSIRVGAATNAENDPNVITMGGLENIVANTENLGLVDVREYLTNEDGISLDDVADIFQSDDETVSGSFNAALEKIAEYRSGFGAVSARLTHVMDMMDISNENISAAQSRIRDVDYASEITNLTKANILVQAGASLLTQANLPAQLALSLVTDLKK
jgi:flagellin